MTHGLRCWDASGAVTLEVTDRIFRVHGVYSIAVSAANQSGTILVTGMTANGEWYAFGDTAMVVYPVAGGFFWAPLEGYFGYDYTTEVVVMRI